MLLFPELLSTLLLASSVFNSFVWTPALSKGESYTHLDTSPVITTNPHITCRCIRCWCNCCPPHSGLRFDSLAGQEHYSKVLMSQSATWIIIVNCPGWKSQMQMHCNYNVRPISLAMCHHNLFLPYLYHIGKPDVNRRWKSLYWKTRKMPSVESVNLFQ